MQGHSWSSASFSTHDTTTVWICRSALVLNFHTPLESNPANCSCVPLAFTAELSHRWAATKPKLPVPSACFALLLWTKHSMRSWGTSSNRTNHASGTSPSQACSTHACLPPAGLSRCPSAWPVLHADRLWSDVCQLLEVLMSHFPLPSAAVTRGRTWPTLGTAWTPSCNPWDRRMVPQRYLWPQSAAALQGSTSSRPTLASGSPV